MLWKCSKFGKRINSKITFTKKWMKFGDCLITVHFRVFCFSAPVWQRDDCIIMTLSFTCCLVYVFIVNWTFTGPCSTVIYSYSKTYQMHLFLKLFILVKHSTCFGRSFRTSSGDQDCTYCNRHMSNSCCYLLLAGTRCSSICIHKGEVVWVGWIKSRSQDLHNLYVSSHNIRIIKSRRLIARTGNGKRLQNWNREEIGLYSTLLSDVIGPCLCCVDCSICKGTLRIAVV
jgi:hypothetical protein